ncbi:MAG: hypothetical protein WC732_03250 [Candidatus Omnitrophota bacterium]
MKRNLAVAGFLILFGVFFILSDKPAVSSSDWPDLAPEPQLLEPRGEVVDLSGKDTLEFKWSPFIGRLWERQYYDFRLYKGRDRLEGSQILVSKVAKNQYSISVDASLFEDGEAYAWGVAQVYMDRKSEQAYSTFEVVKKKS